MTNEHSMRLLRFSVALAIALMAAILLWTAWTVRSLDDKRREAEIATCERGNVVREKQNAVLLLLTQLGYKLPPLTPLVDCEDLVQ